MNPSQNALKNLPKTRVELHVHLDGSVRHETLWELAKKKNMKLPGNGTFEELQDALVIKNPVDLTHFLQPFLIFTQYIAGDLDAIERIAYEFCEDEAKNGVAYVEARYCPHFWLGTTDFHGKLKELGEVVSAVNRGFQRGENDFGVKANTILSALNGTGTIKDIVELCKKFKGDGVVGLDIAMNANDKSETYVEVPLNQEEIGAYEEARKSGIHRTLHAGEAGGAEMVQRALDVYHTERVGHGYRVVENEAIYSSCKERRVHFETCPWSSYLTGTVPLGVRKHPIVRFAEDGVNFSLNSDDPTLTGRTLRDDYALAASWGLTEAHAIRANLNAAHACFLPDNEKAQLIKKIYKELNISD
ncbi:adenosine deaminase-like [Schistocerca gregaria]|uniref:adenosine deaminase-like n=1 Tax=Schistocerca cancellata TaxID=274614 RepID=UPI0021198A7B|nr:adenosine deaminase-like [Schistocerca cancellata]XP_049852888.1 adenosine deaminase-like [Schistocerca gregaria]